MTATETSEATFQINNAKLYVHVICLSINDNIKLKDLKQGFRRQILGLYDWSNIQEY